VTIETLIDKQDNVEIIRDQIASILASETASQVALATSAGKPDPNLWSFRVFEERSNVWEEFPSQSGDTTPIVNVWWDSSQFDKAGSNVVERQKTTAVINLDCYGYGQSEANGTGQLCGDQKASQEVQRLIRLVRNILMAGEYTYLGFQKGLIWSRWVTNIQIFQPQQENRQVQNILGARISFSVTFSEFAPQVVPSTLCLLNVDVQRTGDNQVIASAQYDYENEDF
jgi:hypothetical protein